MKTNETPGLPADRAVRLLLQQGERTGGNFVGSPTTVHAALGLLSLAAHGPTKEQLRVWLGFGRDTELRATLHRALQSGRPGDRALSAALGLFVAQGRPLCAALLHTLRDELGAQVQQLDFSTPSAARTINQWVADATQGRISSILDHLDAAAAMVLVSALHFQADWAVPFKPQATLDRPFVLPHGEVVLRPAMHMTEQLPVWLGDRWHLLQLAYADGSNAMLLALPVDPNERRLDLDALRQGVGMLQSKRVQLQLPSFDVGAEISLRAALVAAGVSAAFDPVQADFSPLSGEPVHVSDVVHRARVTVDERGTEAAAVTAVPLRRSRGLRECVGFTVDRPFWFLIRSPTEQSVSFVGRVEDPRGH